MQICDLLDATATKRGKLTGDALRPRIERIRVSLRTIGPLRSRAVGTQSTINMALSDHSTLVLRFVLLTQKVRQLETQKFGNKVGRQLSRLYLSPFQSVWLGVCQI